ncbi:MAG: hypothetical protein RL346_2228 [Verrucomicrobiota bacterium]|jgi:hypothetical protein
MFRGFAWWCTVGWVIMGIGVAQQPPEAVEEKAAPQTKAIQPRALGAFWKYRTGDYVDGKVNEIAAAHEKVVEMKLIEGVACYRIEQAWDWRTPLQRLTGAGEDMTGEIYFWEYRNEQGSYHFEEDPDDPQPPACIADFQLSLQYPTEKGSRYAALEYEYEVLDTAKKIKVPAGEFTCVVYETTWTDPEDEDYKTRDLLYLSPGVGLVRWDSYLRNDDGGWEISSRENLLSYSLKAEDHKGGVQKPAEGP